ncbi:threonine-phosphate decarboxylase CobD [Peribacillus alkalitolerans]|uniref:threonine-phosphate decarboxylase CobD n=1 Tax=Peribacillus alkalitolerans TaxID=1550385 RepID=UPI0013D35910|nr:threonine-phosphate decarboxylase CobD [Peribacillus alkalitolerans]
MNLPSHGSNPSRLFQSLKIKQPDHIIDFSVNLNPIGSPYLSSKTWEELQKKIIDYPDPECYELRKLLSIHENLPLPNIIVGNGAAELIQLVVQSLLRGKDVLIVEPTFSEYKKVCLQHDCEVHSYVLSEEAGWNINRDELVIQLKGKAALFLCNPNNPTGVAYDKDLLLSLAHEAQKEGILLIIDEAFFDFSIHTQSMSQFLKDYPNLIILRSMTKMYSMAGVRLGYLLGNEKLIQKIKEHQVTWSVNSIAQNLGIHFLQDGHHVLESKRFVAREWNRLSQALEELSFVTSKSSVNFYLLREKQKHDLQTLVHFLLENGIVPRHTYNFTSLEGEYIRLAIKTVQENNQLLSVLQKWRAQC